MPIAKTMKFRRLVAWRDILGELLERCLHHVEASTVEFLFWGKALLRKVSLVSSSKSNMTHLSRFDSVVIVHL